MIPKKLYINTKKKKNIYIYIYICIYIYTSQIDKITINLQLQVSGFSNYHLNECSRLQEYSYVGI